MSTRRNLWLERCNIPTRFRSRELAALDLTREVRAAVTGWLDAVNAGNVIANGESAMCGVGLLLSGPPGHGKTTTAMALARELALRGNPEALGNRPEKAVERPIYATPWVDLLETRRDLMDLKEGDEWLRKQRLIDGALARCFETQWDIRLLVLDDIGKEHATASRWAEHSFDHFLRRRYDKGYPTVITTNVPRSAWGEVYGESMGSFACEALIEVPMVSPVGDRRR